MEIIYTPTAKNNLKEIYDYILKDGKDIADDQMRKIRQSIGNLENAPKMGKVWELPNGEKTDYRIKVISPWLALYQVVDGSIRVIMVVDGRRDYGKLLFNSVTL
jgi:addiction module RelE/StbE family toxin